MLKQDKKKLYHLAIDKFIRESYGINIEIHNDPYWIKWNAYEYDGKREFYASDPLRLLALLMIIDDWNKKERPENHYKRIVCKEEGSYNSFDAHFIERRS